MTVASIGCWNRQDLVRRVQQSIVIAQAALLASVAHERTKDSGSGLPDMALASGAKCPAPMVSTKVVAEAAMLLRSAAAIDDAGIRSACRNLAAILVLHARGGSVMAVVCNEPNMALVHATAHVLLSDLGLKNPKIDDFLYSIVDGTDVGGPERLPNQELEALWLEGIRSGRARVAERMAGALGRSSFARPLDCLGATTLDLYLFTHVLLYVSDMGRCPVSLPRPVEVIVAETEAALAAAIDAGNFDLSAELLWLWPMLRLRWSPLATFSFTLLAGEQDRHGFLPGPDFVAADFASLTETQRADYILRTSYHTTLVIGILCATLCDSTCPLPTRIPIEVSPSDTIAQIMPLLEDPARNPCWLRQFQELEPAQQVTLGEFLLNIGLRRAKAAMYLNRMRDCLEVALACDLIDGPAVRQAMALLQRATALAQLDTPE